MAAAAILYDAMLHGVKWDCQSNLYPSHPVRLELRRKYFRENFRKFETAYFLNISTPAITFVYENTKSNMFDSALIITVPKP